MRAPVAAVLAVTAIGMAGLAAFASGDDYEFTAARPAAVVAILDVSCDACDWSRDGHEAVTLRLALDDRYSQHLHLVRPGRAEYRVALGSLGAGNHRLRVDVDADLTSRELRGGVAARVEGVRFEQALQGTAEYRALAYAPVLYARPNTIGRFSDVPVFMYYETEPSARGTRYRYSVIFTNEDGGTPADRLMATWGRTTDIEYIYSVLLDESGRVLEDDYQGPNHETLPFRGEREGRRPLLWVVTDNNMVLDRGTTAARHAPAPVAFPLRDVSREAVMDAHPWLYDLMARELIREGKIVADAPPRQGVIPDPRQYVYVEACGEAGVTALAFSVRAGDAWYHSDRGVPEYRIVRAGCFRGAAPLPNGIDPSSIAALRFQAYERPYRPGAGQPISESPVARIARVNRVFVLDDEYRPKALPFRSPADVTLRAGESAEVGLQ